MKTVGYTGEEDIERYISDHIEPEGSLLYELYRETNKRLLNPRMASGHIQGRLLKMLVSMAKPMRVLELGTFSGYSAICIAEGLQDGAVLHTFEIDDEMEDFISRWIQRSGMADKIFLHIGNALELVPAMGQKFDMAFIDADKSQYPQYYEMVMDCLNPGGYILADNTLWDGHVLDEKPDRQTRGICSFNDIVANDPRVTVAMVPVRDGLTIIRKN